MTKKENQEKPINFTWGLPPSESFPVDQISECSNAAIENYSEEILQYGFPYGYERLRSLIAEREQVDKNLIIIGQGALSLIDLYARLLVSSGDVIFTENPMYNFILNILRRTGAERVGIPIQQDGIDVDYLEHQLKNGQRPRILAMIPDFQNPCGALLSEQKRQRIIELARQYDFFIMEDTAYRKLNYSDQEMPPSLYQLAPDRVLHFASFSKQICPGLRVGYSIAPQGQETLVEKAAELASGTYINPSYFNQAIVYEFIQRGYLESNLSFLKGLYKPRLESMQNMLEKHIKHLGYWYENVHGGYFIGLHLNHIQDNSKLLRKAQDANLMILDGTKFMPWGKGEGFLRLPFCILTPEEIEIGIARLAKIVETL